MPHLLPNDIGPDMFSFVRYLIEWTVLPAGGGGTASLDDTVAAEPLWLLKLSSHSEPLWLLGLSFTLIPDRVGSMQPTVW